MESSTVSEAWVELIDGLLEQEGCRHGNYQEIPPSIPQHLRQKLPEYPKTRLESARFDWLDRHGIFTNKRIVEIGGNLGYFSIRATSERDATSVVYEPDNRLGTVMSLMAALSGVTDRIQIRNTPVQLSNWPDMPAADLVINLNVIHHAGQEFDKSIIKTPDDWRSYAVEFLRLLTKVAPLMAFQTGFLWSDTADRLVPRGCDINQWIGDLLNESGWRVLHSSKAIRKNNGWTYEDIIQGPGPREEHDGFLKAGTKALLPTPVQTRIRLVKRKLFTSAATEAETQRFALRPLYVCERHS